MKRFCANLRDTTILNIKLAWKCEILEFLPAIINIEKFVKIKFRSKIK